MVVTAKPFARDEEPILLEARNPELETSEDIDPSLEVVSRPRAGDEVQQRCCRDAPLTGLEIFFWQQVSKGTMFSWQVFFPSRLSKYLRYVMHPIPALSRV
jgi:hypothetical protein